LNTRVIITDDDVDFAQTLQRCAQSAGHETVLCSDGYGLISALNECHDPALVFLDVHMKEKDGIEVIEDIKSLETSFRIRFITGGVDTHAIAARMIATARDIDVGTTLYKPFTLDDFRNAIETDLPLLQDQISSRLRTA